MRRKAPSQQSAKKPVASRQAFFLLIQQSWRVGGDNVLAPIEHIKMVLSLATMLEDFSPTRQPDAMSNMSFPLVAGVDEAGRGPLAGPVTAAAVILPVDFSVLDQLDDSKKLSEKRRAMLASVIWTEALVGVGIAEPAEIDRLNVLHATMAAMARAVNALSICPEDILVDGNRIPEDLPAPARAIVGGDASEPAIAAASIIAKTLRDRIMVEAEQRFGGFGLAAHKGYPSPGHKAALENLGPTPIHRLSYRPVQLARQATGPWRRLDRTT